MKGFILGAASMYVLLRNGDKVVKQLDKAIAYLQLRQDILRHDHPEVG